MEKGRNDPTHKAIGPRTSSRIEVIVGVARTLSRQDAVTGIVDREPGNGRAKRGAQFHALEDEVDAQLILTFHVVFFANSFFGPLQRNPAFLSKSLHPAMAIIGALTQDFLANGLHLVDVAENVDDVLGYSCAARCR